MKINGVEISGGSDIIDIDTTYYIATTGDDSTGDGSSGSPWATIGHALSAIGNELVGNDGNIIIQLADGTYNSQTAINFHHPFGRRIDIVGNATTPSNVVLNYSNGNRAFYVPDNFLLQINGLKMVGNAQESDCILCGYFGKAIISNCVIDNWSRGVQLYVNSFAYIYNSTINNNNSDGVYANALSGSFLSDCTVSNNATGLNADRDGRIYAYNCSFSGNTANTHTAHGGSVTME